MPAESMTALLANVVSIDAAGNFEDLDSLRLIDIVELIEATYDVRIAAEHVTQQTFANVNALVDLVARLKNGVV